MISDNFGQTLHWMDLTEALDSTALHPSAYNQTSDATAGDFSQTIIKSVTNGI